MFRPYMAIIRFLFSLKVSLYKLRCGDLPSDYNSSMPIYRRVLYYINVYIFFLSLLVGGGFILGMSAGCQPPLLQGVAVTRLSMVGLAGKKNPYDGHIRPKHVVLLQILEYTSFI